MYKNISQLSKINHHDKFNYNMLFHVFQKSSTFPLSIEFYMTPGNEICQNMYLINLFLGLFKGLRQILYTFFIHFKILWLRAAGYISINQAIGSRSSFGVTTQHDIIYMCL